MDGPLLIFSLDNEIRTHKKNHEFLINNKMISDNVTIADSFNEYFVNVRKSLAQKITSTDDLLSYIDHNNHF